MRVSKKQWKKLNKRLTALEKKMKGLPDGIDLSGVTSHLRENFQEQLLQTADSARTGS